MRFDVKYKTFKILRVKLLILALFNFFFLFSNNILIRLQISIKYNNNKLIIR